MTKNVRIKRNKNIREDLISILSMENPMSAKDLCKKLLERNSNRTVTVNQVSQILRVKEFKKAQIMSDKTALWTLSEYANERRAYPTWTKLQRDTFLKEVFSVPDEDLGIFNEEKYLAKLSIWKYITKEQYDSLKVLVDKKKYSEFLQKAKEMNTESKRKRASARRVEYFKNRYHNDPEFKKRKLEQHKRWRERKRMER